MRPLRLFSGMCLFAALFCCGRLLFAEGVNVVLHINAERSISFTADQSSLNLTFLSFRKGATTDTAQVTYTLSGNDVNRMQDLILVRMDAEIPGINLQVQAGPYSKRAGNASLVPSKSGFVNLSTTDTGLANKTIDGSDGKILDGTLTMSYRAELTEDQTAGQRIVIVTVSFVDN